MAQLPQNIQDDGQEPMTLPLTGSGTIEERLNALEHTMRSHRHLGADVSQKINLPPSYVYTGFIDTPSAGTPFPTGWTMSNPSTGNYVVTHNLGHTNYTALCVPFNVHLMGKPYQRNSTTVLFNFKTTAGVDTDTDFYFAVIVPI